MKAIQDFRRSVIAAQLEHGIGGCPVGAAEGSASHVDDGGWAHGGAQRGSVHEKPHPKRPEEIESIGRAQLAMADVPGVGGWVSKIEGRGGHVGKG